MRLRYALGATGLAAVRYSQLTVNSQSTHSQLTVNSQSTHTNNSNFTDFKGAESEVII